MNWKCIFTWIQNTWNKFDLQFNRLRCDLIRYQTIGLIWSIFTVGIGDSVKGIHLSQNAKFLDRSIIVNKKWTYILILLAWSWKKSIIIITLMPQDTRNKLITRAQLTSANVRVTVPVHQYCIYRPASQRMLNEQWPSKIVSWRRSYSNSKSNKQNSVHQRLNLWMATKGLVKGLEDHGLRAYDLNCRKSTWR